MPRRPSHQQFFVAAPSSTREVRHVVRALAADWGCEVVGPDAALGASELASNAVLHTRDDFELALRPIQRGLHVEIIDRRPDLVPIPVPTVGSATTVTSEGTTGRGLQIVAAISHRWGFSTAQEFKAVWIEVADRPAPASTEPVVVQGYQPAPDVDARTFELRSIPVRAAVASGVHVDELVRELQLVPGAVTDADRDELYAVLDASAPARLHGRYVALESAARGQDRFTLRVDMSLDALGAFAALNERLATLSARLGRAVVPLPEAVVAFRSWLVRETESQLAGNPPRDCPLPD